jgi:hypothetical protein
MREEEMNEYLKDYFTDAATLNIRTVASSNDLGEPTYTTATTTIKGRLINKTAQYFKDNGIGQTVNAVFLCQHMTAIPAGSTITAGSKTYRKFNAAKQSGLFGDDLVRIELIEEAA